MKFTTTLGENFAVEIDAELDTSGEVIDVYVFSASTGEDLSPLIYATDVWDEAWKKAQMHVEGLTHINNRIQTYHGTFTV